MITFDIKPAEIYGIYYRGEFVKYKQLTDLLSETLQKKDKTPTLDACRLSVYTANSKLKVIFLKVVHRIKWCLSTNYRTNFQQAVQSISRCFIENCIYLHASQIKVNIDAAENNLRKLHKRFSDQLSKRETGVKNEQAVIDVHAKRQAQLTLEIRNFEDILKILKGKLATTKEKAVETKLLEKINLLETVILHHLKEEQNKINQQIASNQSEIDLLKRGQNIQKIINQFETLQKKREQQIAVLTQLLKLTGQTLPQTVKHESLNLTPITTNVTSFPVPPLDNKRYMIKLAIYMSLGTESLKNIKTEDVIELFSRNPELYDEVNCDPHEGATTHFVTFLSVLEELFPMRAHEIALGYALSLTKSKEKTWRSDLRADLEAQIDKQTKNSVAIDNSIIVNAIKRGLALGLKKYQICKGIIKELEKVLGEFSLPIDIKQHAIKFFNTFLEKNRKTGTPNVDEQTLLILEACSIEDTNPDAKKQIAIKLIQALKLNYDFLLNKAGNPTNPYALVESFRSIIFEMLDQIGFSHTFLTNEIIACEMIKQLLADSAADKEFLAHAHIFNLLKNTENYVEWDKAFTAFFKKKNSTFMNEALLNLKLLLTSDLANQKSKLLVDLIRKIDDKIKEKIKLEEFVDLFELAMISTKRMNKQFAAQMLIEKINKAGKIVKKLNKKLASKTNQFGKLNTEKAEITNEIQQLQRSYLATNNPVAQHFTWNSNIEWNDLWVNWYFSVLKMIMEKIVKADDEALALDFARTLIEKHKEFGRDKLTSFMKMEMVHDLNTKVEQAMNEKILYSNNVQKPYEVMNETREKLQKTLEVYDRMQQKLDNLSQEKSTIRPWLIKLCWNSCNQLKEIKSQLEKAIIALTVKEQMAQDLAELSLIRDKVAILDYILVGPPPKQ